MVTREFRCSVCDGQLEIQVPITVSSDDIEGLDVCPLCGADTKLERVLTPTPNIGEKGKGKWAKM